MTKFETTRDLISLRPRDQMVLAHPDYDLPDSLCDVFSAKRLVDRTAMHGENRNAFRRSLFILAIHWRDFKLLG